MARTPPPFLPSEAVMAVEEIGLALARARLARGDTQQVAAERCGVHWQTISRIERGDPRVAVGTVFAVLVIYGQAARLFDLAQDTEATKVLMRRAVPLRGRGRTATRSSNRSSSSIREETATHD
jgi:transcriptional regulator with XRE-family HTH domain